MNTKIALPLIAVFLWSAFSVQARPIDASEVPAPVINALKSRHPDAENISIDKELHFRMDLYQVKYKIGDEQTMALFDSQGRPFGHEETIDPRQLPAAVSKKLEKAFAHYSISNTELIRHPDGRVEYDIQINVNGSDWKLAMSQNGNILTKNLASM